MATMHLTKCHNMQLFLSMLLKTNIYTFPTLKGACIDLTTTNAVEIFESLNVLPPFCSTHRHFKTFKQTYTK